MVADDLLLRIYTIVCQYQERRIEDKLVDGLL
jgi:hypothetical protein